VITDDAAGVFADVTGDVLTADPDAHLAPDALPGLDPDSPVKRAAVSLE
jgi:hypothetical protein